MPTSRKVLTTFQAAEYCQVSPFTIRNWMEAEALPSFRTPGGHRRVLKADLDAFLKKHGMPTAELLSGEKRRVLIVDDDKRARKVLYRSVQGICQDLEVSTAADGFEAGALVAEFRPHVVILDLKMPGLDGFQVCSRIKSDPKTEEITVIGITGYYSAARARKFAKCGGWKLLKKPLDLDEFEVVMAQALRTVRPPGRTQTTK